jgi:transcription initiation factor IIE alpha subunit
MARWRKWFTPVASRWEVSLDAATRAGFECKHSGVDLKAMQIETLVNE